MTYIIPFYLLKQKILVKYREQYPYYMGDIHGFGNKEIAQLLDLIETESNERVSEKWVYTHLKPIENSKLPRKDMLDIFSRWVGYSDWDEFVFVNNDAPKPADHPEPEIAIKTSNNKKAMAMGAGLMAVVLSVLISFTSQGKNEVTVCFKDRYTQKNIATDKLSLYLIESGGRKKLNLKENCSVVKSKDTQVMLVVESPYYKSDTLEISMEKEDTALEFDLQPDDYAMMLRAYMNSDLDDWNKRKKQLQDIVSDDAVIQEIMFDEIGVEFLNKEEFINKVTTPSSTVKQMEIVAIEYEDGKIISLKYMQK